MARYGLWLESSCLLVVKLATLAWFFFHLEHFALSINFSDFLLFELKEQKSLA